jgi:transcriptional regulator GlxA family with amidase domain
VNILADIASLSPRQFSRVFQSETGQSPAKAIENLRVQAARVMMEEGHISVDNVAVNAGFGDSERMRRAFIRAFGHPPQTVRRANRV